LQAFDIRLDAQSVASLPVLKGVTDRVRHKRNSLFRGAVRLLDGSVDLLFYTIATFQAVLKADQVPVWILTFRSAQRWRDPFLLTVDDTVAYHLNSAVDGIVQESVAVP